MNQTFRPPLPRGDLALGVLWYCAKYGQTMVMPRFSLGRRCAFVLALGCFLVSLPLGAQPTPKVPVIGFLVPTSPPPGWLEGFRRGLSAFGYVEGQNVRIEYQVAGEQSEIPVLAERLVRLNVDVIVTWTTPAALAVRQATRKIPIVAISGDPVGAGLVASLARPGGNLTGLAILTSDLEVKNLALLKEAVPALSHVAVLWNPRNPVWSPALSALHAAAPALRVKLVPVAARDPSELEDALALAVKQRARGLLVVRDMLFIEHQKSIVEFAANRRLATIFGVRDSVLEGGLMS